MQVKTLSQSITINNLFHQNGSEVPNLATKMSIWSIMTPRRHIVPGSYRQCSSRHWFQAVQQFVPPKGIGGTKPACENVHMINDDAHSITLFHIVTSPYSQCSFQTLMPSSTEWIRGTTVHMINVKGITLFQVLIVDADTDAKRYINSFFHQNGPEITKLSTKVCII